ncbi:hypothetical protein O6H91_09G040100 [Diphasiastrum complanatum]|uniref:Uncharacterized protein n=3 Tax=Diphasiastrum complanatum TaxID=34168 RepID=A0ACC2CNL3_DIPCM|nr:hypothetical protein O6H91_09G040100 [Diphasiastrum complanatum]KAJ7543488.1 hypothetical protein O6H91_09G040100 [Diphasiastrum complanatum]KAJ7543489.1 hypothetical protein O6H91_09G040100 [Diphasiastrum complanatum]
MESVRRSKRQRVAVDYARLDESGFDDCVRVQYKQLAKAVLKWPRFYPEQAGGIIDDHHVVAIVAAERLIEHASETGFRTPCIVRASEESAAVLGIRLPQGKMTIESLGKYVGMDREIDTIDVSTQSEGPAYTMEEWVKYFSTPSPKKPLLNVVSLDLASTKLQNLISAPSVVKQLDLVEKVWPRSQLPIPKVQLYAIMSVAGCYMDFHLDFGGSSVWYHVLSGRKVFLLVPPTKENLMAFEEWASSDKQGTVFFAERASGCQKVELTAGDTLLLPGGWPHCVVTPIDSLVIGGNFLTGSNLSLQLEVWQMEERLRVRAKFRFPLYRQLMWHTALHYHKLLEEAVGEGAEKLSKWEKEGLRSLSRCLSLWLQQSKDAGEVPKQISNPESLVEGIRDYLKKDTAGSKRTGSTRVRIMGSCLSDLDNDRVAETSYTVFLDEKQLRKTHSANSRAAESVKRLLDNNDKDFDVKGETESDSDEENVMNEHSWSSRQPKPASTTFKEVKHSKTALRTSASVHVSHSSTKKPAKSNTTVRDRLLKKLGFDPKLPLVRPKLKSKKLDDEAAQQTDQ